MIDGIGACAKIREQVFIAIDMRAGNELFGNDIRKRLRPRNLLQQPVTGQHIVNIGLRCEIVRVDDRIFGRIGASELNMPDWLDDRDYATAETPKMDRG